MRSPLRRNQVDFDQIRRRHVSTSWCAAHSQSAWIRPRANGSGGPKNLYFASYSGQRIAATSEGVTLVPRTGWALISVRRRNSWHLPRTQLPAVPRQTSGGEAASAKA